MKATEERLADRLEDVLSAVDLDSCHESDVKQAYLWAKILSADEVRAALREAIRRIIPASTIRQWENSK